MNEGRSPYRQRRDKRLPRAIPDHLCDKVHATLPSYHDRAVVSLLMSGAARATELLGMTGQDVDRAAIVPASQRRARA